EKIKAEEQRERAARSSDSAVATGTLGDVPAGMPGLTRAVKLQKKAAMVGFDWNDARLVLEKLGEEAAEVAAELDASPRRPERIADEIGDLLFTVANLARHLDVDPEQALKRTNAKFQRRF